MKRKFAKIMVAAILIAIFVQLELTYITGSSQASASGISGAQTVSAAGAAGSVYYRNKVIVLMYHDVSDHHDPKSLSLAKFKEQLRLMKENHFHWITMEQYKAFILRGAAVPDNAVLLTFDDGYETFYTDTYPILKQFHAPATNFLIVSTIGNPAHKGVAKLNWNQVREMRRSGYDFYSHTFDSHAYMAADLSGKKQVPMLMKRIYLKEKHRRETEHEYERRITNDLRRANEVLYRELGIRSDVLAFPYGAYSKPLLKVCDRLGITVTLTVKSGIDEAGQRNGFRVNAGGMDNDPKALIAVMKKGPEALGNSRFGIAANRMFYLQLTMLAFTIALLLFVRFRFSLAAQRGKLGWMKWKRWSSAS
ncbi:polysaccharide deacetylase family protein [Paenibacillus beijingensis]|uniref:polysaccharide deacetylase family protein n=1 Tax=Paenibacillus beijingensis TaxID=1126833 RepID=UPI000AC878C2|nr:polysaccharide deacetylase family protein [Paenibacillus beijingensis]